MQRKAYTSEPLPISFKYDQYVQGTRDVVYIVEDPRMKGKSIELGKALEFIKDDNPRTKIAQYDNAAFLPVRKLFMVVDKNAVKANNVVPAKDYNKIVDTMYIDIPGSYITKDQLMILDMLYNNNWKRPIYYAISVGTEKYMSLDKYFRLEGLAYRIVPILSKQNGYQKGYEETDIMYDNFMNKFRWGNIKMKNVYVDENNRRMYTNMRNNFQRLAEALLHEGKKDKCIAVLDKCIEEIPADKVPYDYFSLQIARLYVEVGQVEKANKLLKGLSKEFTDELKYYFAFDKSTVKGFDDLIRSNLYFLNEMQEIVKKAGNTELQNEIKTNFEKYYNQLMTI